MKILLVYPQYPDTFWSFKHAIKLIWKKASFPPLGLLTLAAMLPESWEKQLVDMNVHLLSDKQIEWADYVFISAMTVQRKSAREVISRCHILGKPIVAGGPLFTSEYADFNDIDHFVLGEAESSIVELVSDMQRGDVKHIYQSDGHPDISLAPVPLWSLIKLKDYTTMGLQYSRGCPFDCEFCDIVFLNGRIPRTKSRQQFLTELESLYNAGWRGAIFIVDDNFIGNKKKLKQEILPAVIEWMQQYHYPFSFTTEASINIADDTELLEMMVKAGFIRVFIGIETPSEESLIECNKLQNKDRDLISSVKHIQACGLEVMGGFIIGFDNDPLTIFKSQIDFIQKSGIVTAMVGLLNAPQGTRLYQRLTRENRIIQHFSGDNTDFSLNFLPRMDKDTLIRGYMHVLHSVYSPRQYYERTWIFLKNYRRPKNRTYRRLKLYQIIGGFNVFWTLGFKDKARWHYWKFLFRSLLRNPRLLPLSVEMAVYGYHFRKVADNYLKSSSLARLPS